MSDSFSAPVSNERLKSLIVKIDSANASMNGHLEGSIDSIALHHIADEFEGVAREIRQVVQLSIDEYQEE